MQPRSVDDYTADLEADRGHRERELRVLLSFLPDDKDADDAMPIRRSGVLLIYAHLEGFARFALTAYLEAINAQQVRFRAASVEIATASAADVFEALANTQKKSDIFRRTLPDDTALHRAARQQDFVRSYEGLLGERIVLLAERALNFQSNMSADVLRRNLFILGLDSEIVDEHAAAINRLLHVRNAVAHGDRLKNPSMAFVQEQLNTALLVMGALQQTIQVGLQDRIFLRRQTDAA